MKNIFLFFICLFLGGCGFFCDSKGTVTFNVDKSFKHPLQELSVYFGSEKYAPMEVNLKPGESSSAMFCPTSIDSHLDFQFDIGDIRYYWESWASNLFGETTYANKFFKQHKRYEIIIDLKADHTFFIRVYQRDGLFSKKLIVQGHDKMYSMPLEYPNE